MKSKGFSLIELTVATGILSIVIVLGYAAVAASAASAKLAEAEGMALQSLRDTLDAMAAEVQYASRWDNNLVNPPVQGVRVVDNPVTGSPRELVFQVPEDPATQTWSLPIRYRFIQEDGVPEGSAVGDGVLDEGEDLDGNGMLDRHILRIQDINRDGDTDDPGERVRIGGANQVAGLRFEFMNMGTFGQGPRRLRITVTAVQAFGDEGHSAAMGTSEKLAVRHEATRVVSLLN